MGGTTHSIKSRFLSVREDSILLIMVKSSQLLQRKKVEKFNILFLYFSENKVTVTASLYTANTTGQKTTIIQERIANAIRQNTIT